MIGLSPAGTALGAFGMGGGLGGAGSAALREQVSEEGDDLKKKREREARLAGYSPAGVALSNMGMMGF